MVSDCIDGEETLEKSSISEFIDGEERSEVSSVISNPLLEFGVYEFSSVMSNPMLELGVALHTTWTDQSNHAKTMSSCTLLSR